MSRDSAGTYTLPAGTATAANATPILPTQHNPGFNDVATELTNSLDRLGRGGMSANLPMGGFKATGLANGSAATDSAAFGQIATAVAAINLGQGGFGAQTSIASAATVDLGTITTHNALVTGSVTITSLGSSAPTVYPIYRIAFNAALTITHNATSLICLTGANIITSGGDSCVMIYYGSGNWSMVAYERYSGAALVGASVPTGSIHKFRGINTPPSGYIKENGALISRTAFPSLYAYAVAGGLMVTEAAWAAGAFGQYSTGDLSTTFRVPDSRGEFDRAWDDGRGIDTGRAMGSNQGMMLEDHIHVSSIPAGSTGAGVFISQGSTTGATNVSTGNPTTGTHGAETRPRNLASLWCIKT